MKLGFFYPNDVLQDAFGIYIHIPFCYHICPYCDFVKTKVHKDSLESYKIYLLAQLSELPKFSYSKVTLYLGGGSPDLLDDEFIFKIKENIPYEVIEFTIECNPLSVEKNRFKTYKEAGVTRITLGAQSLNPIILNFLGRKHRPRDILENIFLAKKCGLEVQTDFIYGVRKDLPKENWKEVIKRCLDLGCDGFSLYALSKEKNTIFSKLDVESEDRAIEEYLLIQSILKERRVLQWETSNFSFKKPLHNSVYWQGIPYVGIGIGASGLDFPSKEDPYGKRYKWTSSCSKGKLGDDRELVLRNDLWYREFENRTYEQMRDEMVFTLLRLKSGIPLNKFFSLKDLNTPFLQEALSSGTLRVNNNYLQLSPSELIRGDSYALEILTALEN